MGEMTKEKWIQVGAKMREPLKELAQIANHAGLDTVSIGVIGDPGYAWATFIDHSMDGNHYFEVRVDKRGEMELDEDQTAYYTSK